MKIESINNSKVKAWLKLQNKKYRDEENLFLIEGEHLLKEALKVNLVKEIISFNISFKDDGIPFYEVTPLIIKKISKQVSGTNVIAVVKKIQEKEILGNVCLLDNIQDPGNLGAIIRSATAFNIDTLVLSLDTVDLYNEKVIRASEGMIFHLNIIRRDLNNTICDLKKKGYTIYGTDVNKGHDLKNIVFNEKSCIIIGNEGKGMSDKLKSSCHELINIVISKDCESLNASVASSIIFYELDRRK